jgi:hypothetical protein
VQLDGLALADAGHADEQQGVTDGLRLLAALVRSALDRPARRSELFYQRASSSSSVCHLGRPCGVSCWQLCAMMKLDAAGGDMVQMLTDQLATAESQSERRRQKLIEYSTSVVTMLDIQDYY